MSKFQPFENEADSVQIDNLTIENRLDRIELYGSAHITKDKEGLKYAKELKKLIDTTVFALEKEVLPDHVPVAPIEKVNNPFD